MKTNFCFTPPPPPPLLIKLFITLLKNWAVFLTCLFLNNSSIRY
jgi:hypothetical protein